MSQPAIVPITDAITTSSRLAETFRPFIDKNIYNIIPFAEYAITMIMDEMAAEQVPTRTFKYATQPYNTLEFTPTYVTTTANVADAYASGGTANQELLVWCTAVQAQMGQEKDRVEFTDISQWKRVLGEISNRKIASDSTSYYVVRLLEADSSSVLAATTNLRVSIHSRADAEISGPPKSYYEEPTQAVNVIQHIMGASEVSDMEAAQADVYGTDIKQRARLQATKMLMRKREAARISSIYDETNGEMKGIIQHIPAANKINWLTDTTYSAAGETWNQGGINFFERISEVETRFNPGTSPLTLITSSWVSARIAEAVRDAGVWYITDSTRAYGTIPIKTIKGLNRDWQIVEHPRWSTTDAYRKSAMLLDFSLLKNVKMTGLEDKFVDYTSPAERKAEGYRTAQQCIWDIYESIKVWNPDAHYWFDGLGDDK